MSSIEYPQSPGGVGVEAGVKTGVRVGIPQQHSKVFTQTSSAVTVTTKHLREVRNTLSISLTTATNLV